MYDVTVIKPESTPGAYLDIFSWGRVSTNSVEDREERERGLGSVAPS
jgi:hypothetical protein